MKMPLFVLALLLLALLVVPTGHGAHHRRAAGRLPVVRSLQLLPLRVVRTPAVAQQHRQVKLVR